jgi:hypothetical protein
MSWKKFRESIWLEMAALAVISALVYLVHIRELSYYRDDWYYMYDGLVGGGKIFVEMFRYLRPARGFLFELLFNTFGTDPQPYLILLYLWRLIGGMGALWLFQILWPRERRATFFMALLYLLYPGFLWWVQGFEYQPMVLSATLQVFSIVFTLKAVQSVTGRAWAVWTLLALITGWSSLAFVEYAIGMEVFRWLCVYLLVSRGLQSRQQIVTAVSRAASVTLLIPLGFLFWHQFIFENQRKAADLSLQMSALFVSPNTGLWWLTHFFQSLLNVLVFAWVSPFQQQFFTLRLRDTLFAFGLMIAVLAVLLVVARSLSNHKEEQTSSRPWQLEAVSIGLLGAVAGVMPIIIANRIVTFERFSHYALPASLAAAAFVGGLIYLLAEPRIRAMAVTTLVGISVLTHSALAFQAQTEEKRIQKFWQQAVWRIPHLKAGTVLIANYAGMDYQEGNDIVWGPANFIYYPERQNQVPVVISIAAARMEQDTPRNVLEGAQLHQNYIVVNDIQYDFDNLLVLTMPSENSCLHVLDEHWSELSIADTALVALASSRSNIENVITDGRPPVLPRLVFGDEPPREWCYYYEQAQLARQLGNWEEITKLGLEVERLGLQPNDQIEWMPFLQAAAVAGDENSVKQISKRINIESFYKKQACRNLSAMQSSPEMQEQVRELFCGGGNAEP